MIHSEVLAQEVAHSVGRGGLAITPVQDRRSSAFLTKYEIARVVGERARQIATGFATGGGCDEYTVPTNSKLSPLDVAERCVQPMSRAVDPVMIAKQELVERRLPMVVQRRWPNGTVENIPVSELAFDVTWLDLKL